MGDSCQMSVSLLYVFVTGQGGGGFSIIAVGVCLYVRS